MKYQIEEALTAAIMTNTPLILVEGIDDIPIYEAVAKAAGLRSYQVKKADLFDCSPAGGCDGVLACVQILQNKWQERNDIGLYFIAFIDADLQPFKEKWGEIKSLKGLFVLDWYAIEAYFIAPYYIQRLLCYLTRLPEDSTQLIAAFEQINQHWQHLQEDLFLFALDALQKELQPNPTSISKSSAQINSNQYPIVVENLKNRRVELVNFGHSQNLNFSKEQIIKRCLRSKDLIIFWIKALFCAKEQRISSCNTNGLPVCENCQTTQNYTNCYYQHKYTNITDRELKRYLMEGGRDDIKICTESFSSLIEALSMLLR